MRVPEKTRLSRGFSLVELAVVMAIVAFLLGSLMYTVSAQVEQRNFEDTRRRLDQARELLLGFAVVNGRLPCPATASSSGDESPAGGGTCNFLESDFLAVSSAAKALAAPPGSADPLAARAALAATFCASVILGRPAPTRAPPLGISDVPLVFKG